MRQADLAGRLERARAARGAAMVRVEEAWMEAYAALARFHYLAGPPATVVRVLAAREEESGEAVGVLVVSMPTLNGAWRELAWPGRYRTGDRRADARRLNAEVRTISRVIVEPRRRGSGVATRLVRAYLDDALTPATEAVAAMGAVSPFFRAAGMREYRAGPTRADARLADALAQAGVSALRLLDAREARKVMSCSALVRAEVEAWSRAGRRGRRHRGKPPEALARAAACALLARPIAYAHSAG